jgi:hypothetical protein
LSVVHKAYQRMQRFGQPKKPVQFGYGIDFYGAISFFFHFTNLILIT